MDEEIRRIIDEACKKARDAGYAEGYLAGYIDREIEVQRILAKRSEHERTTPVVDARKHN